MLIDNVVYVLSTVSDCHVEVCLEYGWQSQPVLNDFEVTFASERTLQKNGVVSVACENFICNSASCEKFCTTLVCENKRLEAIEGLDLSNEFLLCCEERTCTAVHP